MFDVTPRNLKQSHQANFASHSRNCILPNRAMTYEHLKQHIREIERANRRKDPYAPAYGPICHHHHHHHHHHRRHYYRHQPHRCPVFYRHELPDSIDTTTFPEGFVIDEDVQLAEVIAPSLMGDLAEIRAWGLDGDAEGMFHPTTNTDVTNDAIVIPVRESRVENQEGAGERMEMDSGTQDECGLDMGDRQEPVGVRSDDEGVDLYENA
ncbi:hypothetical protein BC936DRAFT_139731 [Jimgerdemannia flammicorona]|uniref:Uncharacterized protein n=1 Tax=Jimgerdemannia flammicorona TaxID=994334 RepID=A0A433DHG5_9FUNG|nr:hypothetical protein BC936DRAFT_139731 [Jimgerdemannia flammicorona]